VNRLIRRLLGRAARLELVLGDITTLRVDAIVNAAKFSLLGGGGVDGAIHKAAGPGLLAECRTLRATAYPNGLEIGQAAVTTGGRLPARWVIHTVGPQYRVYPRPAMLRSCYTESLAAADRLHARTVAFPLISSGVYGWPVEDAIVQAVKAITGAWTRVKVVQLVMFDVATYELAKDVFGRS
jgi:O-acetyl-ADP-ribose deacetylase (regulator of RNase III)